MKLPGLFPALAVLLLTACSEEPPAGLSGVDHISFGVDMQDMSATRACSPDSRFHFSVTAGADTVPVLATTEDFPAAAMLSRGAPATEPGTIRVWSAFHKTDGATLPFFEGEQLSERGNDLVTATPYYWPDPASGNLSFTAISNAPADGFITDMQGAALSLEYTVPAKAEAQNDIMVAETDPVNGASDPGFRVPLSFRHICAGVRFRTGQLSQPGTITRISLSGIKNNGTFAGGGWSAVSGSQTFVVDAEAVTDTSTPPGTDLYAPYLTMMMLPQDLGAEAKMEVVFRDDITGETRTLVASLAGQKWSEGKITTYQIGITAGFDLEFTDTPETQDAHYVMCNTAISVSNVLPATGWTLTATASDGADVTIQREADVNEYARQGFWLDKEMTNGHITTTSVRGTASISGTGAVSALPVRVFIPENTGDAERTVTLTLHIDGTSSSTAVSQTITQLCPDWQGSTGWEQIYGHEEGIYGFCYDAVHVYVYNNSHTVAPANRIVKQVENLIAQYDAGVYAKVTRYSVGIANYRNYVEIDYRKLNTLDGKAESAADGLQNTRDLFALGGTATTSNFENAILNMNRVTDSSVKAYRRRADNDPSAVPQWIDGTHIGENQVLALVLKKNRYYLNTTTGEDVTTTTPLIHTDDIVWYLPASGQFGTAGTWAVGSPADYWSSTASSGLNALTGSGATAARSDAHLIRVARNRP